MAQQKKQELNNGIERICLHWTAGMGMPNNLESQHYHIMVDNKGSYHLGYHKIEDNINCKDGNYAQHCALGNTGTIGIALCGMAGFSLSTLLSKSNITRIQLEACCKKMAELCKKCNIKVTPSTVYTHAEYDSSPSGAHEGKIDIVYIPYLNLKGAKACGDYIRGKVQWYLDNADNTSSKGK